MNIDHQLLFVIAGFFILTLGIIFFYLIARIFYQYSKLAKNSESLTNMLNQHSKSKSSTLNDHLFMTSTKTASSYDSKISSFQSFRPMKT